VALTPAGLRLDAETKALEAPHDHKQELRLWLRLLTCTNLIEAEIRRRLREAFDTTLPRFDLLAQLERAPHGMTLGELSKRMMVSNGNITGLVERLVDSGHIDRSPLPSDRRVQVVVLTDLGREEFARMAAAHEAWVAELMEEMAPADVDRLLTLLGRLKDSLHASSIDPGTAP
jgi:DNA-binding MarR family transcriptional regulator